MTPSRRPDSFYALGVRPILAEALAARGIVEPFPIQAAALPDALAGRDVLGRGRTGSGKTVAFALPVLERILSSQTSRQPRRPRALILVPTRELAVQVAETVEYLAQAVQLRAMTVFGGVRYTGQIRKLERGVDVVVATPGRLEDLIEQGALKLDAVEVVVLDEADLMADMGFLPPVTRVLEAVPDGQRMLFSATLDGDVEALVKRFLHAPLVHEVDTEDTAPDAEHYLFLVRHDNKPAIVAELLSGGGRTLAFTRTKHAAERLALTLTEKGIPAVDLHGNLRQAARQRNLAAFADGSVTVLIATDIAARGIHVDDVGLVVHIDPPNDPKAFLHRSGRTARAGSEGNVVTLATKNQNKGVRELMAQAKIKPTQVVVKPGDPILTEVRAPAVDAIAGAPSIFLPDPEDVIDDEPGQTDRSARSPEFGRRESRPARGGSEDRPVRSRAWGRDDQVVEGRGERDERRGARAGRPSRDRDARSERPARAWGREDRPRDDRAARREPTAGRGARPDWSDTRPRPARRQDWTDRPQRDDRPVSGDRRRENDVRPSASDRRGPERETRGLRGGRGQKEWTADWWGPEPWEVEDTSRELRPGRPLDGRGARPERGVRDAARPGKASSARGRDQARPAWGRDDRRPGPGRDERQGYGRDERRPSMGRDDRRPSVGSDDWRPARDRFNGDDRRSASAAAGDRDRRSPDGPRDKGRWTTDDRRKRDESSERGFGFRKAAPASAKPKKSKVANAKAKPGKPVRDKDKGKPKRKA